MPTIEEWNLDDLYPSTQVAKEAADLLIQKAEIFEKTYQNIWPESSDLKTAYRSICEFEEISEILARLMSYAYLNYARDVSNNQASSFLQSITELSARIRACSIIWEHNLQSLDDKSPILKHLIDPSSLYSGHRAWILQLRRLKPHQLSPDLERFNLDHSVATQSWVRLFDETLTTMKFKVGDKNDYTITTLLELASSPDTSARKEVFKSLSDGLTQNKNLFALIFNTLAYEHGVDNKWRKFKHPADSRHINNEIEPEIVATMVQSVKDHYKPIAHRYYQLKAKYLGITDFCYEDRNAPAASIKEAPISFSKARDMVLYAVYLLSPHLVPTVRMFFERGWIQVHPSPNTMSGAFAHPTVPSAHPYLLLNYQGSKRDVMTLAHELGHGLHQMSSREQGALACNASLTLSETVSIFCERMTFGLLLSECQNDDERKRLLFAKIDDQINSVIRQVAFYDFEERFHTERQNGEVSFERMCEHFVDTQKEALGPNVHVGDHIGPLFSYISHFIHNPFYVYAYAFGECVANSFYALYMKSPGDFDHTYRWFMRQGGKGNYHELLKPFGLDLKDPNFWNQGLSYIKEDIDQLEALMRL